MRFGVFAKAALTGLVWACLVGCGASSARDAKDAAPEQNTAPAQTVEAAPSTAASTSIAPTATPPPQTPAEAMMGTLPEEAFKALHLSKGEKAPAPQGEKIKIEGANAYLSLPKGKVAPLAGLVVVHEWWGLNAHIQHWADRLAEDGYAAIAVDLYGGKVATTPDEAMAAMKSVDEKRAMKVLVSAHDFLEKDERIKATRTGVIGWCMGGGFALKLAMNEPDLDAAVIYYGMLVTDPVALKPIKAEVLGVFGNKDKAVSAEKVNEFEKSLLSAGVKNTIHRYDADHAFANPTATTRYDEKSAADAWAKVRAFLQAKLKQNP